MFFDKAGVLGMYCFLKGLAFRGYKLIRETPP
jgi:hypothetical protein